MCRERKKGTYINKSESACPPPPSEIFDVGTEEDRSFERIVERKQVL